MPSTAASDRSLLRRPFGPYGGRVPISSSAHGWRPSAPFVAAATPCSAGRHSCPADSSDPVSASISPYMASKIRSSRSSFDVR